jgi:TRAP-type C4-dicarboxylate transport system permease small subunit
MLTIVTKTLNRLLLAAAVVALAAMMLLIAMDVLLRYLLNSPIPGAFELTEYLMAVLVPFSIAFCAEQKRHVAVDFVYARFTKRTRDFVDLLTCVITILFLSVIVWQSVLYVGDQFASRVTSAVLKIPAYPFVVPITIGLAVFTLVLCAELYESLTKVRKE